MTSLAAMRDALGIAGRAVVDAATTEPADYTLAPAPLPPPHLDSSDTCRGCYARCETPETHNWGCPCAPHGPRAARQIAKHIAAHAHSHLVADGTTVCLSGCGQTPGQVLL